MTPETAISIILALLVNGEAEPEFGSVAGVTVTVAPGAAEANTSFGCPNVLLGS